MDELWLRIAVAGTEVIVQGWHTTANTGLESDAISDDDACAVTSRTINFITDTALALTLYLKGLGIVTFLNNAVCRGGIAL